METTLDLEKALRRKEAEARYERERADGLAARVDAIHAEVKLQAAHLDEYSDRLTGDERLDREVLLAVFGNIAHGIGPEGQAL